MVKSKDKAILSCPIAALEFLNLPISTLRYSLYVDEYELDEKFQSNDIFQKIIADSEAGIENYRLEYQSVFDDELHTLICKIGKYSPVIYLTENDLYNKNEIQEFQTRISLAISELEKLNINPKTMGFRDLFEKNISPESSQIAVELISFKTRIEEMYRSFYTKFDHYLELCAMNNDSLKQKLGLKINVDPGCIPLNKNAYLKWESGNSNQKIKLKIDH